MRHADGLVRGQQRGEVPAIASEQDRGAGIDLLGQAEASVFPRDFDAESAESGEPLNDVVGISPS